MKKLRKKFITIAMVSIFSVLTIIVGGLNISNFISMSQTADKLTHMLADNNGSFQDTFPSPKDNSITDQKNPKDNDKKNNNSKTKPNHPKEAHSSDQKTGQKPEPPHNDVRQPDIHNEFTAETPFQTRYFYVQYDTNGKVSSVSVDHIAAINEAQAKKYANEIKDFSAKKGFLDIYRYCITTNDTGTLYLFVDCQKEWNSFRGTLYSSILLSVAGMVAVFVLVFFFSHLFLRPVEESYTKQKQFITDAGHELKTPLTIIDANTEVLEMEHGVSDWTKSIRNQVEHLSSMVQQLITLSKMDEGGTTADKQTFCLSNALAESTDLFVPVATTSGKRIQLQLDEQLNYWGDEKCIRQMFCLLLDNAVKYASENSVITVTLKKKGRKILFEIHNICTNLEKGDQSVLFERFYRSDQSRNSEIGGTGIGLSVVKSIADSHKSKIHAKSPDGNSLLIQIVF